MIDKMVTKEDISRLTTFLTHSRNKNPRATTHNIIMKWLDANPSVTSRFVSLGIIKAYGAYLIEYQLSL